MRTFCSLFTKLKSAPSGIFRRRCHGQLAKRLPGSDEELNDLYCAENIMRVIKRRREIGGVCSTHGGSEMQAGRWSENMIEKKKYFAC